jgi:hypothetical protein
LLKLTGFEVKVLDAVENKERDPPAYLIGVTDLVFHAIIWLYERKLKKPRWQKS